MKYSSKNDNVRETDNIKINYRKLAELLFSDSKKLMVLASVVLLAALSFSLFFLSINSTIVASKRQDSVETHGRFLVVLTDIDKRLADEIMEKEPMFDYQIFQVQDEMYCKNSRFFSGWVTEETGKCMGIFLKEGVWPKRENEILLEEYLAYHLGISEFPQSITIMVNGEEKEYLVCGIIKNYSGSLSTSRRDLNIRKDYPSVITSSYRENAAVSLLILQKRLNFGESTKDIYLAMDLVEKYGIDKHVCALDKYMDECYRNTVDFEKLGLIYMAAVFFLLLLVEAVVFRAVVLKNRYAERSLKELGLTGKKLRLAYGWQLGKLLLGTLGIQVIIGILWAKIGGYFTGYGKLLEKNVWYTLLKQFTVIAVLLLIFAVMAWDSKTWEKTDGGKQRKNFQYLFGKLNLPMLLMQTVFLVFVLFSLCMKQHFAYKEKEIRITITAQTVDSFRYVSNYAFSEAKHRYFEHDSQNLFEEYQGVLDMYMGAEMQHATLLGDKQAMPPYFARLLEMQEAYGFSWMEGDGSWENVLQEEAKRYEALPEDTFRVVILPDQSYQLLLEKNGIFCKTLDNVIPECVMVLPLLEDERISDVQDGSQITVGRIYLQNNKLLFEKEEFCAFKVLKSVKGMEKYFLGKCLCGLIFSATQAKKSELISGYSSIEFRLKEGVTKEQQEKIDNEITMLAASAQGGSSYSTIEGQRKEAFFLYYAALMGTTMFIFAIFAMVAFVFIHYYVSFEENKYVYGIFRSMGMSYRTLQQKIFVQYITGTIFSCFFAYIVIEKIFGYDLMPGQVFLGIVFLVMLYGSCYIILYRRYRRISLCEMLQEE